MTKNLKSSQIAFFFIAFLPVTKIFIMPSLVARQVAEDLWIAILFNLLLDFFTIFAIVTLTKNNKLNFYELLEATFGKVATKIIFLLYVVMFLLKCLSPFAEQKDYVVFTLYIANSNPLFFTAIFIIPFYLALKNLKTIGRISNIVWVLTALSFFLIFCLTAFNIDLNLLLPIGASGITNMLKSSYSVTAWFGDCVYFIFFLTEFKKSKNYSLKILLGYGIACVLIFIFSITFWCAFSSIAFRQRFALTELSKYVTLANNIGRFDYIAIFFLLFAHSVAVSLPIYFSSQILNRAFGVKRKWIVPLILTAVIFIAVMFLGEYFHTIEQLIEKFGGILFITLSNVVPVICAVKAKIISTKEARSEIQNA